MNHRLILGAALAAVAFAATSASAQTSGADVIKKLNKDSDQTLEMAEVIDAAVKVFEAINPDGDATLETDETKGRLTEKDWKKANKDGDETLEMDEWLSIVRQRFHKANPDKDGSLDAAELDSKAGQNLILMIVK